MLPYQQVSFVAGTSLSSELAQEKWLVCLQLDLPKICSSFPARREAQSRTWLCGACIEQEKPWETSSEPSIREQPGSVRSPWEPPWLSGKAAQAVGEEFGFPPCGVTSYSSGGGVVFSCSGIRVISCTLPAKPSLSRRPKLGDTKSQSCLQRHRNSTSLCSPNNY